ncbi:MAG: 2'-5' RNA ligase family protein [candidate division Zixibacteria bacterium]|nr:2'-5' RNA ligase family protein [candidate division Zixibacteria bacterium]
MAFGYSSGELAPGSGNQYAVVIFLPDHLDRAIAPIRERYDPDYSVIASHISLVFPCQTRKPFDEIATTIRKTIAGLPAFTVELESIGDFYPGFPLIYWEVRRNAAIDELYKTLYAQLDLALPIKNFIPHVTLAKEISDHRVVLVKEKIVPYLFEESFQAETIDLIAPIASKQWVSVRTFTLAGT